MGDFKPAPRAAPLETKARDQHRHQQRQRDQEKGNRNLFEMPIINAGDHARGDETQAAPDDLRRRVTAARLAHARAVEHYQPQREQSRDAKHQDGGGELHQCYRANTIDLSCRRRTGRLGPPNPIYRFPVPPGAGVVGVPRLVTVAGAVALLAAGSFSFSPAAMRSVFRPLSALIWFTVVWWAVAIFDNVSPLLTT